MYIYICIYTHTIDIGFCIPPDGAYGALELWWNPLATSTAPRSTPPWFYLDINQTRVGSTHQIRITLRLILFLPELSHSSLLDSDAWWFKNTSCVNLRKAPGAKLNAVYQSWSPQGLHSVPNLLRYHLNVSIKKGQPSCKLFFVPMSRALKFAYSKLWFYKNRFVDRPT